MISVANWRNKKPDEDLRQPRHAADPDYGYSVCWTIISLTRFSTFQYIDPLSRGASAKSHRNFPSINVMSSDDDNYAKMSAKIREWAEKNAQPVRTIEEVEEEEIATPVEEAEVREDEVADSTDPYGRIPGRIREWAAQASDMSAVQSQASLDDKMSESERSSRQPKPDRSAKLHTKHDLLH